MKKSGHNLYDVFRMTGIPPATTQRFLSGEIDEPRSSTIKKWALAYNVSESQLRGDLPIDGIEPPTAIPELKDLLPLDEYEHISVLKKMDIETKGMLYQLTLRLAEQKSPYDRRTKAEKPNPGLRIGDQKYIAPAHKPRKKTPDEGKFHSSKSSRTA